MTCDKCNMTLNEFYNKSEIELHPCGKEFLTKRKKMINLENCN